MKRRYRYRLRREVKETIGKIFISLILATLDVVIYHYLGVLGSVVGENTLSSGIIGVGWFWLLAGQFMWLFVMWE